MNRDKRLKHNNNQLSTSKVLGLISAIDTSRHNGRQAFYSLCIRVLNNALQNSATFKGLQSLISVVIETERTLFDNSRVLNFITNFLVAYSDGDSIQCTINLRLLDYILTTYHR